MSCLRRVILVKGVLFGYPCLASGGSSSSGGIFVGPSKTGIQEMVLEDNLGQQTYIRFQGMKLNIPIDVNRFQFQLPANADLIGKPS